MKLNINEMEKQILIDLVESHVRELHPTIRRSRVSSVTEELKHDLEDAEVLLTKLRGATEQEAAEPKS